MKTSYQREMKRNYLIVDPELSEIPEMIPFEQKMLEQNQIDGILHFQVRQKDEKIRFFYEITSRQPLIRMLEGQSVQAPQIRALVFGIAHALDHMEQYLLSEKSVLLDPEYLYVDPENLKVWLCLVPGRECDFPEDYSKLLEYLLGKVDHRDKESVVLAYGLYQETRKENYGMGDILRLAQQKYSVSGSEHRSDSSEFRTGYGRNERMGTDEITQTDGAAATDRAVVANESSEWKWQEQDQYQTGEADWKSMPNGNHPAEWQLGTVRTSKIQTDSEPEQGGFFGRWKERRKKRQEEKQREYERALQMPWEMMFAENDSPESSEDFQEYGAVTQRNQAGKQETAVQSFERPMQSSDTVLLNGEASESSARIRRLVALDAGTENIAIAYYPFIIGKQENLVDYVLARETVSRLHLRIDRKDDRYYVQDLNSTNGTSVGGHMLENNETMEIWDGVEVNIAGVRYRFE